MCTLCGCAHFVLIVYIVCIVCTHIARLSLQLAQIFPTTHSQRWRQFHFASRVNRRRRRRRRTKKDLQIIDMNVCSFSMNDSLVRKKVDKFSEISWTTRRLINHILELCPTKVFSKANSF